MVHHLFLPFFTGFFLLIFTNLFVYFVGFSAVNKIKKKTLAKRLYLYRKKGSVKRFTVINKELFFIKNNIITQNRKRVIILKQFNHL